MKKRTLAIVMSLTLAAGMLAGCGSKKAENSENTQVSKSDKAEVDDQKAADEVADLIDAIYVQERNDKTDEQCKAAKEAWDKLCELKKEGNVADSVDCIITDIEMPQMDGHRLTKLVKSDDAMKSIPLIIFSSLVNEEMKRKGEQLGADAQLTKPELGQLVEAIDKLIHQNSNK